MTFKYPNGLEALTDISIEFHEGSITAIVGENGSGKTTLAKHMNGIFKPTTGVVTVNGIDTRTKKDYQLAKEVGYVFQNPAHQLYNESVRAELAAGPKAIGLSEEEVESRVKSAAGFFKISAVLDSNPQDLSFPMKKLVAIASIYSMRPPIMLLDEPTTGQDHVGLDMICETVKVLNSEQITVVIITHDMRVVAETAQRMVVMAMGKIVADGKPEEIFTNEEAMTAAKIRPPQVTEFDSAVQRALGLNLPVSIRSEDEIAKLEPVIRGGR